MAEREKKSKELQGVAYKCAHCGAEEWRVSRSGNWVCTQCNQPVAVEELSWTGEEEAEPPPKEGKRMNLARKSAAKKPEPRTTDTSDSYYTESEPAPSPGELRHKSPESDEDRDRRSRRNRPAALLLVDQWIPRGPHVEKKNFDADKKKLDEEKRMHYVVKKQSDALGTRPLK